LGLISQYHFYIPWQTQVGPSPSKTKMVASILSTNRMRLLMSTPTERGALIAKQLLVHNPTFIGNFLNSSSANMQFVCIPYTAMLATKKRRSSTP